MCGAATAKARLPTVDSLTGGTTKRSDSCVWFRWTSPSLLSNTTDRNDNDNDNGDNWKHEKQ